MNAHESRLDMQVHYVQVIMWMEAETFVSVFAGSLRRCEGRSQKAMRAS